MNDDELTRLLRRSAPDARPPDQHRRRLRMQLEHNFRYHRRRWRFPMPLAALTVGLALLTVWTIPLGGDDFNLRVTNLPVTEYGSIVEDPTNHRFILNPTSDEAGRLATEDREREIAAGKYEIVGFHGLGVADVSFRFFDIHTESDPPGHTSNLGNPDEVAAQDRVMAILKPIAKDLLVCMENGDWATTTTTEEVLQGMRFRVTIRTRVFPKVGEVRFIDGERIR